MRLFVGLFPPEDICSDLLAAIGEKRPLTPVERWHVTLAFLGEQRPEERPEIERAISRAVYDDGAPFRLRLAGGGSFGSASWAGVDGDLDALHRFRAALMASLAISDLLHDDRPFRPHLTVSYRGGGRDLREALAAQAGRSWTVDEIALVHSRHADGLGYTALRTWAL